MKQERTWGLSSFGLHVFAMGAMLCDHLWATVVPGNDWLTWIGRLAFPVFAFLIAEGYSYTRDFGRYWKRLAICALISELPFNLMYTAGWIFPFHQNVLWSFVLGLFCLRSLDKLRDKYPVWAVGLLGAGVVYLFYLAATVLMVDYYGYGLLMIVVFYLFRGNAWWQRLGQLAGMVYINWYLMGSMRIVVDLPGLSLEIPQQGMAVLALLPIWAYRGRQGTHNRITKWIFYGFYPAHMLILGLLSM